MIFIDLFTITIKLYILRYKLYIIIYFNKYISDYDIIKYNNIIYYIIVRNLYINILVFRISIIPDFKI